MVVSIRVVATGRVAEGPSHLLGEDMWEVFVLDPFPDTEVARLAHACEVVCRSQDVAKSPLETVCRGDRVVVSGDLLVERVDGPMRTISALRTTGRRAGVRLGASAPSARGDVESAAVDHDTRSQTGHSSPRSWTNPAVAGP